MAVGSVQDAMLAAVAVGGMKGGAEAPQPSVSEAAPQEAADAALRESLAAAREEETAEGQERVLHEPLTEEQTEFITEQLNEIMRNINVNLQFQYHKEVNFMSVRMLDKKTGEVLREVPPESMVEHMIKVRDWIGAFLDKTS